MAGQTRDNSRNGKNSVKNSRKNLESTKIERFLASETFRRSKKLLQDFVDNSLSCQQNS